MSKQDILDYVMHSPYNTNRSVLEPMLESIGGITPTGETSITSNGIHDVTNYASANVNVSSSPDLSKQTTQFDIYTTSGMEGTKFVYLASYSTSAVGVDGKTDGIVSQTEQSSSGITSINLSRFKNIEPINYGRILVIGADLSEYRLDFSNSDDYYSDGYIYVKLSGNRHTLSIFNK